LKRLAVGDGLPGGDEALRHRADVHAVAAGGAVGEAGGGDRRISALAADELHVGGIKDVEAGARGLVADEVFRRRHAITTVGEGGEGGVGLRHSGADAVLVVQVGGNDVLRAGDRVVQHLDHVVGDIPLHRQAGPGFDN